MISYVMSYSATFQMGTWAVTGPAPPGPAALGHNVTRHGHAMTMVMMMCPAVGEATTRFQLAIDTRPVGPAGRPITAARSIWILATPISKFIPSISNVIFDIEDVDMVYNFDSTVCTFDIKGKCSPISKVVNFDIKVQV
jgi:hypothetical protein